MMMYNVATHSAPSVGRLVPVTAQRRERGREKGQPSRRLSDPPQCVLNRQSEEEEQKQRDGHLAPPRSSARRHQRGTYSGCRTLKDISISDKHRLLRKSLALAKSVLRWRGAEKHRKPACTVTLTVDRQFVAIVTAGHRALLLQGGGRGEAE